MKALFITTSFPRSESDVSAVFVHRLAEHLIDGGVQVEVVAPGDASAPARGVVGKTPVHRATYMLPRSWQRLAYGYGIPQNLRRNRWLVAQVPLFLLALFVATLRRARWADVLHAHWTPAALVAVIAGLITRTPVVVTILGTDVRRLPGRLNRWILHRAHAVVAFSYEMQTIAAGLGVEAHPIPLPVDTARFSPLIGREHGEAELGIARDTPVVVYVGRLSPEKDPETLLEAFPAIRARVPTVHAVFVGDGPLAAQMKRRIHDLGVADRVHMVGTRPDVERFLGLGDVFVSLGVSENLWSTTIVEATFCGVPVVLTRVGFTDRVFTDRTDCLLVPPRDPVSVAEGVSELLLDPDLRRTLADACRELHRRHGYVNEQIVARHKALYQDAISARGAADAGGATSASGA